MRRILTAAVLVPLLWAVIKFAPAWAFDGIFAVGIGIGTLEVYRMLGRSGRRPLAILGVVGAVVLAWSFGELPPDLSRIGVLAAIVVATWIAAIVARPDPEAMYAAVVDTLVPVVAIALPLSFMLAIRALPHPYGEDLLVLLIVCVTFGDTAAFYVGSAIGRRRLAPALSPKKSWEGAVGGLAASVAGAVLASAWFFQRLSVGHALVLGVLLGALGILGDLSESMVKRAVGAKDSSRLLPGHGGLLDRMDSLLLAAPALWAYWRWFLEASS